MMTEPGFDLQGINMNLSAYDGIALQVEGDGQTYKLNLKTADQENVPEDTFQATFDTVAGMRDFADHIHGCGSFN